MLSRCSQPYLACEVIEHGQYEPGLGPPETGEHPPRTRLKQDLEPAVTFEEARKADREQRVGRIAALGQMPVGFELHDHPIALHVEACVEGEINRHWRAVLVRQITDPLLKSDLTTIEDALEPGFQVHGRGDGHVACLALESDRCLQEIRAAPP